MKRYLYQSNNVSKEVLFKDKLVIDLEVTLGELINIACSSSGEFIKFPGVEKFKQDALNILMNEYKFDVIEDEYEGVKQRGHSSNRKDSISLYFDTYYDLSNADYAIKRLGISSLKAPESGTVYCYIHIRISDHLLPDMGQELHRKFLKDNMQKYGLNNPDVTHGMYEEEFELKEKELYYYYNEALDYLRESLDHRIALWVRKKDIFKIYR